MTTSFAPIWKHRPSSSPKSELGFDFGPHGFHAGFFFRHPPASRLRRRPGDPAAPKAIRPPQRHLRFALATGSRSRAPLGPPVSLRSPEDDERHASRSSYPNPTKLPPLFPRLGRHQRQSTVPSPKRPYTARFQDRRRRKLGLVGLVGLFFSPSNSALPNAPSCTLHCFRRCSAIPRTAPISDD